MQATLEVAARERGIDPARLAWVPMRPLEQHLARLACADVFLDAWPCNAHTTAGEALWMGVPVVTILGDTFAQRVGASLLHQVGLDELVAADPAAYVEAASALAADAGRRAALRARLERERVSSPLFDGARFAHDFEALCERLWAHACAGRPPTHALAS